MSGSPSTGPRRRATSAPPLRPWASGSLGTKRLKQAVAAYTEALKEHTREQVPLKWGRDAEQPRCCPYDLGQTGARARAP